MGACCSSEAEPQQQARPVHIGRPEAATLHIPRRRVGPDGIEMSIVDRELTSRNLENALTYVGEYLHQRRQKLTIITVGGAVNTMYLRSRQMTHDVDFFGSHLSNNQLSLLDEAMQYAQAKSSIPLGEAWLNNETQLHMGPDVYKFVTNIALEQDIVVFEHLGVKVIAAPWSYAFLAKAERVGTPRERAYDLMDTVMYVREWLRRISADFINIGELRDLCRRYRINFPSEETLKRIDTVFRQKYGRPAFRRR